MFYDKVKNSIYKLLRTTERYTGTDMIYLTKGGGWLTVGQVVSYASSFVLAVAFANLLPKETYGIYQYVISISGILAISCLSGMQTSVVQAVARGFEGTIFPAIKAQLMWGVLGSLTSLAIAGYYFAHNNTILTLSFIVLAVFLPFTFSFNTMFSFLQGKKEFAAVTKHSIFNQIISVAALILALFITKNVILILITYFASWSIVRYISLNLVLKKYLRNRNPDPTAITYGKHLTLLDIISTVADYIDRILVFNYLGAAQLAVYTFAYTPPEQIKGILKNINVLALPKLSAESREEIKKTALKKFWKLALAVALIIIGYIVIAPYFFAIFFPQYIASVQYSQFFVITLLGTPAAFLATSFTAKAMKREQYLLRIIPFFRLVLLIIFTPIYGIWGVITTIIFSKILAVAFTLFLFRRM